MGNSDSSYPQVPPGSLPGLSCKMVVRDPLVGYIQVPRAFISNILLSLQVSSSSAIGAPGIPDMGAPRDPNNEIFFSWSRFIIKYIFHKVYYLLDERTKIGSDFYGLPIQSLFHVLMVHWEDQTILVMLWLAFRASCRCSSVVSVSPPNLVISMGEPNHWAARDDRCTV